MSARVESGEECYRCRSLVSFFSKPPGHRQLCHDCAALDDDAGEVTSERCVRCPRCKHQERVADADLGMLYEEGEHSVSCSNCEHDYEVSTHVSFLFESPALLDQPEAPNPANEIPWKP